ncbi:MAG: DUF3488 and transglutaminase-like domain-containing protein [Acidobacteriota bacterium]
MTFLREKRMLLGLLALLAPLPLPLNEPRPDGVIGPGFLVVYELLVFFFLFRSSRGAVRWLRPVHLNLMALAYLPFFYLDMAVFYNGQLVRPMMHLALFSLLAKLFSIEKEGDKWQVVIGIFFVFITSMATSAGPGIVLYLLFFVTLGITVLARFAMFHVRTLGGEGEARSLIGAKNRRPSLVWLTGLALLVAVPLFVFLPRLRNPYIMGSGSGSSDLRYVTGFSDEANLDIIGSIRSSDTVALRAQFEGGRQLAGSLRLKAIAYDRYEDKRWLRAARRSWERRDATQGAFRLGPERPERHLQVWLQPIGSMAVIAPTEARSLQFLTPPPRALGVDPGGSIYLPAPPASVIEYQVGLGPVSRPELAKPPGADDASLDLGGVTPAIAELAESVVTAASALEQIRQVEEHLMTQYQYTLDLFGRPADNPVERFLTETRSGHCEYFASAMVLMLRSQGIPARFVTGYLGGEYNPLEGYYVVRQNNAHAWVEAYVPELGWQTFDPTPPAGRPGEFERSLMTFARQTYDWLQFRWDRYVISYGVDDQQRLFSRLARFWSSFWEKDEAPEAPLVASAAEAESEAPKRSAEPWIASAAIVCLLVLWWLLRRERRLSATQAYLRLRRIAQRRGLTVSRSDSAEVFQRAVVERFPDSGMKSGELVSLYLRESYAEQTLTESETQEANRLLREIAADLRKAS